MMSVMDKRRPVIIPVTCVAIYLGLTCSRGKIKTEGSASQEGECCQPECFSDTYIFIETFQIPSVQGLEIYI